MAGEMTQSDPQVISLKKKTNLSAYLSRKLHGAVTRYMSLASYFSAAAQRQKCFQTTLMAASRCRTGWEAGLGGCSAVVRRVTEGLQMQVSPAGPAHSA